MDELIAKIRGYWLLVADCDKGSDKWAARYAEHMSPLLALLEDFKRQHLDNAGHLLRLMEAQDTKEKQ